MLRKFYILVFVLFGWKAHANISLSPYFLEMGDSTGRTGQVRFTNTSQSEKTYDITLVNFAQKSDGAYTTITTPVPGNPFADAYLEWSPHQATLQPGQSQVVRVRRRGMAAVPNGEYVSHLLIREQPAASEMYGKYADKNNALVVNLQPLYGVSIPVMIEHGRLWSSGRIDNVRIVNRNGHPVALVSVSRDGNRSFFGTVTVSDGRRELGRIANFRIFMTTPVRVLEVPLTRTPSRDAVITLIDENANETVDTKNI